MLPDTLTALAAVMILASVTRNADDFARISLALARRADRPALNYLQTWHNR